MTLHDMEVAELTPLQRKHYEHCVTSGTDPKMALMFAVRRGPRMKGSDQAFNEGARLKMSRIPQVNQKIVELAEKAGINTNGKYHVSGLGSYTNPLAWCSTIEDAKASVRMQGLNATGLFEYTAPEKPPVDPVPLAPDLVAEAVASRLSRVAQTTGLPKEPRARAKLVREVSESVCAEQGRPRRSRGPSGSLGEKTLAAIAGS